MLYVVMLYLYHVRVLFSALTTTCEIRTVSNSRTSNIDFVIGKLAVDEYLYDKTKKRSSSVSSPYTQTKVTSHIIFVLSNSFFTTCLLQIEIFCIFQGNIMVNH